MDLYFITGAVFGGIWGLAVAVVMILNLERRWTFPWSIWAFPIALLGGSAVWVVTLIAWPIVALLIAFVLIRALRRPAPVYLPRRGDSNLPTNW